MTMCCVHGRFVFAADLLSEARKLCLPREPNTL